MIVLRRSRLTGCVVLTAGLAVSAVTGAGAARAQAAAQPFPTRSAAVSWGSGLDGRLGDGLMDLDNNPAENRMLPGTVVGLTSGVAAVSAGEFHAMALTSDGRVWTWGDNLFGNLGTGTRGPGTGRALAAPVAGLTGVVQVAAGTWASYALRSDGTVWAWGADLAVDGAVTPTQVPGLTGVTQIAANQGGPVLALRSDGTVWGWGSDSFGALGTGAGNSNASTPIRVKGLSGVTAIAVGGGFGLAITRHRVAGAPTPVTLVYAWGDNQFGELGDGTQDPPGGEPVPQVVRGLPQVTAIAAGSSDAMAIGSDGSVWAWGSDALGQLGIAPRTAPVLSPVETFAPGSGIIQVSAALDHTLALRSNDTVLAFGRNSLGQLGTGTTNQTPLPVQVSNLTGATQVSAGLGYSLAVHQAPLVQLP
jgi:alpha-tubulin suppressor-like RCC1 family protein